MSNSVFAKYQPKAYPYMFEIELTVRKIAGGTPSDPNVAKSWLMTKVAFDKEELWQRAVAEVMLERGKTLDKAVEDTALERHLNGFRRDRDTEIARRAQKRAIDEDIEPDVASKIGELYLEGRCLKAAIKEAANIRWPKERWGVSKKGTLSFFPEHVFVQEDKLYFGVTEPDEVLQRFVHTWRGNGISYDEIVWETKLNATIATDYDFSEEEWALLWSTGEKNGIGACRSQGYGQYDVTKWEPLPTSPRNLATKRFSK